jgi:hypothetical protein
MPLMMVDDIQPAQPADVTEWVADNLRPEDVIPLLAERWGADSVAAAIPGDDLAPPVSLGLKAYSQRDPEWASDLLGYSSGRWTMGNGGCAVTSVAIVLSRAFPTLTPGILNAKLKEAGGFYGAELDWSAVPEVAAGVRYVRRRDWNHPMTVSQLAEVEHYIQRYGPVVMEVDYKPRVYGQQMHFVVATEWLGDDVRIIDPWDGAETKLLLRYADPDDTLADAIWGVRVYDVSGALE